MATTLEEVQNEFSLEGMSDLTVQEKSEIASYPFMAISEISEVGKTYGEKAIEAAKGVYDYVFGETTPLEKQKPTGTITGGFDIKSLFQNALKPPYIFIILGVLGLWIFGIFKRS